MQWMSKEISMKEERRVREGKRRTARVQETRAQGRKEKRGHLALYRSWVPARVVPTSRFAGNTWDVPHTNSQIQGGRHNKVLGGVEACTHHIVVVASKDGNTGATLPVPDADGLVIWGWEDPWVLLRSKREQQSMNYAPWLIITILITLWPSQGQNHEGCVPLDLIIEKCPSHVIFL